MQSPFFFCTILTSPSTERQWGKKKKKKKEDQDRWTSVYPCYLLGFCRSFGRGWVTQEAFEEVLVCLDFIRNFNPDRKGSKRESKIIFRGGAEKFMFRAWYSSDILQEICEKRVNCIILLHSKYMKGSCLKSFYSSVVSPNFQIPGTYIVWLVSKHCSVGLTSPCTNVVSSGHMLLPYLMYENWKTTRQHFEPVVCITYTQVSLFCFCNTSCMFLGRRTLRTDSVSSYIVHYNINKDKTVINTYAKF